MAAEHLEEHQHEERGSLFSMGRTLLIAFQRPLGLSAAFVGLPVSAAREAKNFASLVRENEVRAQEPSEQPQLVRTAGMHLLRQVAAVVRRVQEGHLGIGRMGQAQSESRRIRAEVSV